MEGWGSLQPPSLRDIRGRGGATKGLSAPPPPLTHLVVLDFEWTADDRRKMEPCSEITQFPSVLVRLDGHASAAIDEFDTFVRPIYNPLLSAFAVGLTAITQADVDAAPPLAEVLPRYLEWLRGHGLVDASGRRLGSWCVCTWSDADIGGQLSAECRHKGIALPASHLVWNGGATAAAVAQLHLRSAVARCDSPPSPHRRHASTRGWTSSYCTGGTTGWRRPAGCALVSSGSVWHSS